MRSFNTNSGMIVGAKDGKLQPNWVGPHILSPVTMGASGMFPQRTDISFPGGNRLCFATFSPGYVEAGVPIRSVLIPTGRWDTVGTTTVKLRIALFTQDALSDDATYNGLHKLLLDPTMQMSAGVSLAQLRTNGGGSTGRFLKAFFDGQYTPVKSQPVKIVTIWEMLYTGGGTPDALSLQGAAGVLLACSDNGGPYSFYNEVGSGSVAISRNYAYVNNGQLTAGIDNIPFSTFENPTVAHYQYTGGATYSNYGALATVTHNNCTAVGFCLSPE